VSGTPRAIGFWTAVALVIGSMIGSGVFLLPASLASYGGLSLAGWVVSAAGSALLALVFAHLARRNPAAGGVYAYTRDAFGDLAGFLVAWGYWIAIWSADAALAVAFVGYLDPFIPSIVRAPGSAALLAVGSVWFLTAVNSRGIVAAGRVQVVTTTLKLVPLVIVGIGGLMFLEPAHFAVPAPAPGATQGGALLAVVTMTLFAFVGLEAATIPADAVKDPDRTIPRATIVGTIATAVIYVASTAGAMSLVEPASLAQSSAPFAEAARALGGDLLGRVVAAGAAISAFGALNGWIMIVGQLSLAVADDGIFPRPFARLSARGLPVTGMVIAGVLSTGLLALNYSSSDGLVALFTKMMLLSTLATLVPYAFCSLAVFLPGGRRASSLATGTAIVAALAFVYSLFAIGGAGADVVYLGFLLIVSGLPVYVWVVRQRASRDGV
jgi:APA family basic amino acid/polyamine antiporter